MDDVSHAIQFMKTLDRTGFEKVVLLFEGKPSYPQLKHFVFLAMKVSISAGTNGDEQTELMNSIKAEISSSGLQSCAKTKHIVYLAQIFLETSQWAQRGSIPNETITSKSF